MTGLQPPIARRMRLRMVLHMVPALLRQLAIVTYRACSRELRYGDTFTASLNFSAEFRREVEAEVEL